MYYNGNGITQALVILGIYALVFGALSQLLGSYRTPRLKHVTPETDLQAASVSIAGTRRIDANRPLTLHQLATTTDGSVVRSGRYQCT